MWGRVTAYRFAFLVLAISLLVGVSPHLASADDLNRSQSQGAALIAVGNESEVFDGNRLARCVCSSIPDTHFCSATFVPASSWFHDDAYSPAAPRKLFRLNVVFLI